MFKSSGRQREIDHNSYGIRVRFQVVDIRGRVASEQLRKIVIACPQPQHLPLLTPPGAVKDKVLSRLRYLIAISKVFLGLRCISIIHQQLFSQLPLILLSANIQDPGSRFILVFFERHKNEDFLASIQRLASTTDQSGTTAVIFNVAM